MSRVGAAVLVALWIGATLVLSAIPRIQRPSLLTRLAPYHQGTAGTRARRSSWSVASMRDVLAPLAELVGLVASRITGTREPLARRLARVHSPLEPTAVRLRQLALSVAALGGAGALCLLVVPPPLLALGLLVGAPLTVLAVTEHRITAAAQHWQADVFSELPVVAEQLGMLLSSGWSLGGAIARLAERGSGCCARDLGRVAARTRQGLSDVAALGEWAEVTQVAGVQRLVHVLALHRDTTDLGQLIAEESRVLRAEAHRQLIATLDRRSQSVWIPVTVATLVPGVILMSIPFISVMRVFANG